MGEPSFTLHMPSDRVDNAKGTELNRGTNYVNISVVLEPELAILGECRWSCDGFTIALREWNEQVFLHELLHAATAYSSPHLNTTYPPHGHDVLSRIEVALWETGWRFRPNEERKSNE